MEATRQNLADRWAAVQCLGVEIGQVGAFPRDYPTTYAKLVHLVRDDRYQLHLVAGLGPEQLLEVLTDVQARVLDAGAGKWSYHPPTPWRGIPEQRVCSWQRPDVAVPHTNSGPVRRLSPAAPVRVRA